MYSELVSDISGCVVPHLSVGGVGWRRGRFPLRPFLCSRSIGLPPMSVPSVVPPTANPPRGGVRGEVGPKLIFFLDQIWPKNALQPEVDLWLLQGVLARAKSDKTESWLGPRWLVRAMGQLQKGKMACLGQLRWLGWFRLLWRGD